MTLDCTYRVHIPHKPGQLALVAGAIARGHGHIGDVTTGDIGPLASMPVMEGKALFYRQLAGISAFPILVDTTDLQEFVDTVVRISPGFAGIHLEDISAPDCFEIERQLLARLDKPVMHDDVHGTAVVTLAAVLVASHRAGLAFDEAVVGQIGLGA